MLERGLVRGRPVLHNPSFPVRPRHGRVGGSGLCPRGAIDDFRRFSRGAPRLCPSGICGRNVARRSLGLGTGRDHRPALWLAGGSFCGCGSRNLSRLGASEARRSTPGATLGSRAHAAATERPRVCFADCGGHLHHFLHCFSDFLGSGLRGELQGLQPARSLCLPCDDYSVCFAVGSSCRWLCRGSLTKIVYLRAHHRHCRRIASLGAISSAGHPVRGKINGSGGILRRQLFYVLVSRAGDRGLARYDAPPRACHLRRHVHVRHAIAGRTGPARGG